jgi:hypothetical protein
MEQGGGGGDFSGGGEHNHALDMDMDEKQRQQDLAERAKQCEQHQEEVAAGKIRTVNYDTEVCTCVVLCLDIIIIQYCRLYTMLNVHWSIHSV